MRISNTATRLKELMSEMNLKQIDLLKMTIPYCRKYGVKMNKSDISQYCSGKVEPNQNKLFVLGATLNVSEAWLMGYDVPKQRGPAIITDSTEINSGILYAIKLLAAESGYNFDLFAKQYQISTKDYIVKLSLNEVEDYVKESIQQIHFITNNIINNKLRGNIIPISEDYIIPDAAHIDEDGTDEERRISDAMMYDDSEWT